MRFGYWMPIFGGWLRNVEDEGMAADWSYVKALAVESEAAGFDLSLIAELNLNDIKGHRAPSLDCWTLAPAVAAVTERLELMLAVRPNYHSPSLTAKALSTLDSIAPGRISLNVVSSWWKDEASQYGAPFDVHDARYERTEEWLTVLHRLLTEDTVTHTGALYDLQGCVMEPKPSVLPTVYMGGESPKAKEVIGRHGGAYVMHGDAPDVIAAKIADMDARVGAGTSRTASAATSSCATPRRRRRPSWPASSTCRASPGGVRVVPGLRRRQPARVAGVARGVLGVEPRAARRAGRHARAGDRPHPRVRGRRRRPDAAAVQPAARGDGALRRAGHRPVRAPRRAQA